MRLPHLCHKPYNNYFRLLGPIIVFGLFSGKQAKNAKIAKRPSPWERGRVRKKKAAEESPRRPHKF